MISGHLQTKPTIQSEVFSQQPYYLQAKTEASHHGTRFERHIIAVDRARSSFSLLSNSITNVTIPMCREYFHAPVAATKVSYVNLTAYISNIYQTGTGYLLDSDEWRK